MNRVFRCSLAMVAVVAMTLPLHAQVEPEKHEALNQRAFRAPQMDISAVHQELRDLPAAASNTARQRLGKLGITENGARVDRRGGRFATLFPVQPILPGTGVNNSLTWGDLEMAAPKSAAAVENAARRAFMTYLKSNEENFDISVDNIPSLRVTVHNETLIQIFGQRSFNGIPVRGSYVGAVINHGNINLMGFNVWGDRGNINTTPSFSADEAFKAVETHAAPFRVAREFGKPHLEIIPFSRGQQEVDYGKGYQHRLVWSVKVVLDGDQGHWEGLVDAQNGRLLSFQDTNHYAEVKGGVLPVTNDGINPDGVEQAGWPMPFADVSGAVTGTTNTGGSIAGGGSITSDFYGPYVNINDNCGSSSLTANDTIDWGTSAGTDCTTPGFGGGGNTHASRTGFYELNKIIEMGRGQLPSNTWLTQRLTSNMNINATCNAFWNGTVNFYRSGGGCFNTGEIAGVFDHEWGHGMDANDANPGIASPSGEGIADIYTALRLNSSCIGRNFRSVVCSGNGNTCNTCTGVRDIDYQKKSRNAPHTYSYSNANCGGSVHCVGHVYSEAVWSLWKRILQSAPYNYDNNTAHEIVTRLTFIGAGATSTWFSGGPPNGGCAANSGYQNYIAADDDNGNLNDGTPHMNAIYQAFNDQEIACGTPTVQDSGCGGGPTSAPTVNTSTGNELVQLTWNAVPNTTEYEVFRTEGVFQCDFGKVKVASTTGTSFTDTGLQNGRDYSYVVIPKGSADACFGPASACATAAPVGQPDFTVSCSPTAQNVEQGQNGAATCTVFSAFGYSGNVSLSCSGNPGSIGCAFSPSTVSVPANGSAASNLTLSVSGSATVQNYGFDVIASDGGTNRASGISVQVTPAGQNGPQTATFDGGLGAPRCTTVGSSCDSNNLAAGRANLGPESNQPNTLDGCADGTSGSYQSDESLENIVVRTLDLFDMVEGATVEIEATVFAWSTGASDTADFYYAADANSPSWTYIGSVTPPGGGIQTLTQQYTLPAAGTHAVRVNFRYQGSAGSCTTGAYDDRDDLVFEVASATPGCSVDADCDDGLFCNGSETCNAGTCQAGTAPNCNDGVSCTDDSCNEGTDSCDNVVNDGNCDNGLFCDGAETCDAVNDCQAGTAPNCNDGVACTDDSCNEGTDSCDNNANDANCDDGAFCNGAETCDAVNGCQAGSDPCAGGACDEVGDVCLECVVDADCDDGLFCNGTETCNAGSCQAGSDPCSAGETCDEGGDVCVPNPAAVRAEWGTVSVGSTATTVNLNNTFTSPVVVTAINYNNNTIPVVTRISNVSGGSFDVRLQAAAAGTPVADTVSYLVVEEGAWSIGGVNFEAFTYNSTVTDENNSWVGQAQSYQQSYTSPVVLGQVMSSNDADWSVFWNFGSSRQNPPDAANLNTGKTVAEDTNVTRANETVGVVIFEADHGTLGGVEFEAALGADSVRGVTNAPPYAYTFNTTFASAPSVGLATMAAVDGGNGGWAYTFGGTPMTATTLNLVIDEDQINDTERNHTPEQVGYVVFAGAGSVSE